MFRYVGYSLFVMATATAAPAPGQWRRLPLITEGKIDAAWAQVGWGGFVVDAGSLRTECDDRGMGLLFYKLEKFGDCQIRVVYRCEEPTSNAGVFVRVDDGVFARIGEGSPEVHRDPQGKLSPQMIERLKQASKGHLGGWYPVHHGYEVQICDADDPWHRTGAVYSLSKAAPVPEKPLPEKSQSDWRTMIITLDGERITVHSMANASAPLTPRRRTILRASSGSNRSAGGNARHVVISDSRITIPATWSGSRKSACGPLVARSSRRQKRTTRGRSTSKEFQYGHC